MMRVVYSISLLIIMLTSFAAHADTGCSFGKPTMDSAGFTKISDGKMTDWRKKFKFPNALVSYFIQVDGEGWASQGGTYHANGYFYCFECLSANSAVGSYWIFDKYFTLHSEKTKERKSIRPKNGAERAKRSTEFFTPFLIPLSRNELTPLKVIEDLSVESFKGYFVVYAVENGFLKEPINQGEDIPNRILVFEILDDCIGVSGIIGYKSDGSPEEQFSRTLFDNLKVNQEVDKRW